jgi:hypothetical protein
MSAIYLIGTRQVPVFKIEVDFIEDDYEVEVNHGCEDLEVTERCVDCIADYYDGIQQMHEDRMMDF